MKEIYIFGVVSLLVSLFILWKFRFLFIKNHVNISNDNNDFIKYFKEMLSTIKSNEIVLSDGILNFEVYKALKSDLKQLLDRNVKLIIYCGPLIEIDPEYKMWVSENGYLNKHSNWYNIHPILNLKYQYKNQVKLIFNENDEPQHYFFYSEFDKFAWKKDDYRHFANDSQTTYFRKNIQKSIIGHLKELEASQKSKSFEITEVNAHQKLKFKL